MAELSEEQLLLLDNMMYYSGAADGRNVKFIAEQMIEDARAGKTELFSGGFESSPDTIEEIGKAILSDPELCNLIRRDSIDTDQVRASCFTDTSGETIIAIKGTGGTYEAWSDNFQGIYQSDTTAQKQLVEFVEKQSRKYSNITITGHSKGGNLAQYATVLCGDSIDRCISFDGQGFGDEFLRKYEVQIAANSGKIKSVCAEGDFVNILLFSIAGETVYLNTGKKDSFAENHSPYLLWKENSGKMIDGEFSETVEQSAISKALDYIADSLVIGIDTFNPMTELFLSNILGALVATAMSKNLNQIVSTNPLEHIGGLFNLGKNLLWHLYDISEDAIKDYHIKELVKSWAPGWKIMETITYLDNLIHQAEKNVSNNSVLRVNHLLSVDTRILEQSLESLSQCASQMSEISSLLNRISLDGKLNVLYYVKLSSYRKAIENETDKIRALQTCLGEISSIYSDTENSNMHI